MLSYLHVKNIALIDDLEVEFGEGLNILTGETGAGKSIIIGSMDSVLGQKLPKDFLRQDAEYALVEMIFQIDSEEVNHKIAELDIEIEGELLISRKITNNGRSVFKANGQTVTLNEIKTITSLLVDLHSQHEHQSLLERKNHQILLDRYLGDEISPLLLKLSALVKEYNSLKNEAKDFTLDDQMRNREIAFLEFEINEIANAELKPGEDLTLDAVYRKQSGVHTIQKALSEIHNITSESSYSISNQVEGALGRLQPIMALDETLTFFSEQLIAIEELINDLNREILHYADSLFVDEELLSETKERIDLIHGLKSKYGRTIEFILDALEEKSKRYSQLLHFEERLQEIQKELIRLEEEIISLCEDISSLRKKGAMELTDRIEAALQDLNLKNTSFKIQFNKRNSFHADGYDDVEFLISTNPGEPLRPLIQIASGGELSRVMLAIKSVLADCDNVGTLIFDEIDTGISGRTAQMVAEKMLNLSRRRQIICITHLPQIASMADHHYLIEKQIEETRTITTMTTLTDEEIPSELARLIGGAKITDVVMAGAMEMKQLANALKK